MTEQSSIFLSGDIPVSIKKDGNGCDFTYTTSIDGQYQHKPHLSSMSWILYAAPKLPYLKESTLCLTS